ncbi:MULTISPECIES: putative bifunctional diguanylate cyclase/phosphodiesterase [Idiomarina]|uniref:putative bifunctional diguanylate cyclase/phosphodiesterase n=1 Tax=Idiomarina TaxID=135575 RepID=UPI00129BA833|nr:MULTISPECIES: bifunctional diguanylate cyclase/phosphodiesterase [Idiomarina]MRJ41297.1 EAL domain-containing protein [Idiomarina sp. FeN1]NCU56462.1 EAL domain-containing protein [Idiomarina sp. FenA--70]NCU59481.1 EAL domain-containing protein [Idiomarina sp. FenBw--71]UUN12650.1 EAL domain-containing protein [Idiomarina loihiensis]
MRIIQVDQQARAVTHLVLSLSLLLAGILILGYRYWEPTQLPLYHSMSSSLLLGAVFNGLSLLTFDLHSKRSWQPWLSRAFAVIGVVVAANGLFGSVIDPYDSQVHPITHGLMGILSLWLALRLRGRVAMRVQALLAAPIALGMLTMIVLHFYYQQPLMARHPIGSLISCTLVLLAALAVWNASRAGHEYLPPVSTLTTGMVLLGLAAATSFGLLTFHNQMNNLREQGREVAQNLNESRRSLGSQHLRTFERVAERWGDYPASHHDQLMDADVKAYLEDIDFLESMMLLEGTDVVWEQNKNGDSHYTHLWNIDPYLRVSAAASLTRIEMLIASRENSPDGTLMFVRLPLEFTESHPPHQEQPERHFSLLAVFDVPLMLAPQTRIMESPITAYTMLGRGVLIDYAGYWISDEQKAYLASKALFLYDSALVTDYNTSGNPIQTYLVDLSSLQERANLEVLVVFAGILLVLMMALTVERNRELVLQGRQLKFQAEHDALTGLFNRTTSEQVLADRFHKNKQQTVLFIDLDGFTYINDSLGLQVGDRLLQVLAQRLEAVVGKQAILGRFGGDEFLIITDKVHDNERAVKELTDKLLAAVAQPYRIMHHKIYLTASIGVAHQTDDQYAPLELVQRADMAMHQAKRQGHNHVQVYQESMSLQFKSSAAMRSSLQEAIERNQLTLHYQPIVRCSDTATVGYEALLRWEREPGRFIPPSEFIPLAEMTGQIIPLSEWVFRRACEAAVQLQQYGPCKVAVNLSTLHFNRSEFKGFLERTLEETGCQPQWLELELTESILMENTDYAVDILQSLRDKQISISLDDFGTGFSSLSYLRRLPVDKVKIDRSFVAGIKTHRSDRVLIGSVIKIAQSLNFKVVAEGVETPQQAEFVTELGCDYMQGFYFGRPVPLDDLFES